MVRIAGRSYLELKWAGRSRQSRMITAFNLFFIGGDWMKIYIRTSKGDTDLLPDTVDCAKRISNMDYSVNIPFKLTGPGEMVTKDGVTYTPWESSNELYPSELVFDLYKATDDQKDSGNLALILQKFDTGNHSRFSLVIDGGYYQNLGANRCLDTANFPVDLAVQLQTLTIHIHHRLESGISKPLDIWKVKGLSLLQFIT